MEEREQVKPLAPASDRPSSNDDETTLNKKKFHQRRCFKYCVCVSTFLLILAIILIILIFTVFKIKDPIIRMNGVTMEKLDLVNTSGTILPMPKPGSNMTIKADVSVKNPNYASFRYSNTTTTISYRDTVVGEARGPPGKSKARRTMRMNITIDIITDKIVSHPGLQDDISTGLLTMNSFTSVGGRVKLLNMIKKHVVVKMNCSITVNITSQSIQDQKCTKKVKL
ncbi:hypothetical protein K7X08_036071 [Anisodus acutangulus]|uniref:Late embryogenesis abundant protein LEA-2 subgroup domain-containing protein n=2 Tax=Anisodus TaxID=243963 RepID=A0A9Q1L7Y2_9SOLA|nr:hypothetical protein K7X08_036071 [Anisodus acutangulus]KAK4339332.1 hypothetical protein RND71_040794 [Anisodus tanguticus]